MLHLSHCAISFLVLSYLWSVTFASTRFRDKLSTLLPSSHSDDNAVSTEQSKLHTRRDIVKLHRSDPQSVHKVIFAIQQRNVDQLERILLEVSDPRSSRYGQHLTTNEVDDLTSNDAAYSQLIQYLEEQQRIHGDGVNAISVVGNTRRNEYVTVEGSIQHWERIFKTQFFELTSTEDPDVRFNRADHYHLPAELIGHVSAVFNTVQLPDIRYQKSRRLLLNHRKEAEKTPDSKEVVTKLKRSNFNVKGLSLHNESTTAAVQESSPAGVSQEDTSSNTGLLFTKEVTGYVTPALLNRVYSIASNDGGGHGSQAVYETIGQSFSPSDLALFQKQFGLPNQPVAHDIGGHMSNTACKANYGNDCIEANLDVQYIMAVAQSVPTTYYYWAGDDFLLDWIQQVANMANPPLVFSISYGVDEPELPDSYGREFDLVAMKLGVRGVTILASSGDDGAVSPGAARDSMMCVYSPSFPATSPYVTAVGGTMGPERHTAEVVCQSDKGGIITSGGGFSTIYSAPSWQSEVVQRFLQGTADGKGGVPGKGAPLPGFHTGGRGYPDVSALAFNYVIAVNNNFTAVSGTSASSPVMAGMVALVNSARIAAGKSALGWINPALYQLYEAFAIDITEGSNNCAAGALVCCGHGFSATPGWDPVTGLGSVNFAAFKEAFLGLGDHPTAPSPSPTPVPGKPTPAPIRAPTEQPTIAPTSYPTVAKGWLVLQQYTDTDCAGDVSVVSGVPLGVCLVEFDSHNRAVGSIEYSCNTVEATVSVFQDTTCRHLVEKEYFGIGCALSVLDSYYADDNSAYSTSLHCELPSPGNNALVPPTPVSVQAHTYTMQSAFDSQKGCQAATLSEYTQYLDNHCFDVIDPMYGDYSYKFAYPSALEYSKTGCKGHAQTVALPTTCTHASNSRRLQSGGASSSPVSPVSLISDLAIVAEEEEEEEGLHVLSDDSVSTDVYEVWSQVHSHSPAVDPATTSPTRNPTLQPTLQPTLAPSVGSTDTPTLPPTFKPTLVPSVVSTGRPTAEDQPTVVPTVQVTAAPSVASTDLPTLAPVSVSPSVQPINIPTTPLPSVAPSGPSIPAPAPGPPANQLVVISVEQLLRGVTSAEFKAAGPPAKNVFKHAAAKTMMSVEAFDITVTGLADTWIAAELTSNRNSDINSVSAARQLLKSHQDTPGATAVGPAEEVWVCVVKYTVQFSTIEAGYTDSVVAYNAVAQQLTGAILDGRFDVYVHEYAQIYQVKALENVITPHSSSTQVVTTSFSVVDHAPTGTDDAGGQGEGIGAAGIAAIVVVVSIVLLILVCACNRRSKHSCIVCGKRAASRYSELALDTESTHEPSSTAVAGAAGGGSGDASNGEERVPGSLARMAAQSVLGRRLFGGATVRRGNRESKGRNANYGTAESDSKDDRQQGSLADEEAGFSSMAPPPGAEVKDEHTVCIELSPTMYNPLSSNAI